jgi:hypothetical protein
MHGSTHWFAAHEPLAQSPSAVQACPRPQPSQLPPQSVSLSSPLLSPSSQAGGLQSVVHSSVSSASPSSQLSPCSSVPLPQIGSGPVVDASVVDAGSVVPSVVVVVEASVVDAGSVVPSVVEASVVDAGSVVVPSVVVVVEASVVDAGSVVPSVVVVVEASVVDTGSVVPVVVVSVVVAASVAVPSVVGPAVVAPAVEGSVVVGSIVVCSSGIVVAADVDSSTVAAESVAGTMCCGDPESGQPVVIANRPNEHRNHIVLCMPNSLPTTRNERAERTTGPPGRTSGATGRDG